MGGGGGTFVVDAYPVSVHAWDVVLIFITCLLYTSTECILVVSKLSPSERGGRMEGRRLAIIDLPLPGAPTIIKLCPPAAATSSALFTFSCPLTLSLIHIYAKVSDCYKNLIGIARKANNAPLMERTYESYIVWTDSVKALTAQDELNVLKRKYDESQLTIQEKDDTLSAKQLSLIHI